MTTVLDVLRDVSPVEDVLRDVSGDVFRVEFSTFAGARVAVEYVTAAGYDAAAEWGQRRALALTGAEWLEVYQRGEDGTDEYVAGWEAPAAACGGCGDLLFGTPTGPCDRRGRRSCGTGTVRHEPDEKPAALFTVDCPACWFPGGAPVPGEVDAVQLAGRHDDAAHGGVLTAEVVPAWGEVQ